MSTIAFIGAGNMASALMGGMIENGVNPESIIASDPSAEQIEGLKQQWGIQGTTDNIEAVSKADVVVIAVKPQVMEVVLAPLKEALQTKQPMLISVAAGINLHSIDVWSGGNLPIVRCMPNTPALVQQGASGLFANAQVSDAQKNEAETILAAVGISVWVNTESELDAVTAVSGSGPAYYFLLMETMIEAGKKLGLSEETATQLTLKTALGAATMASQSEDSPAELRRKVTSPNGTTEQAINTFVNDGLPELVEKALSAASHRSEELCEELGAK